MSPTLAPAVLVPEAYVVVRSGLCIGIISLLSHILSATERSRCSRTNSFQPWAMQNLSFHILLPPLVPSNSLFAVCLAGAVSRQGKSKRLSASELCYVGQREKLQMACARGTVRERERKRVYSEAVRMRSIAKSYLTQRGGAYATCLVRLNSFLQTRSPMVCARYSVFLGVLA